MRERSHKGQRHKGCSMCKYYKQVGNGKERRPVGDRRQFQRARDEEVAQPIG